jgi:DNA modification methylase
MTKDKAWDAYKDPTSGTQFYIDFLGVALAVAVTDRAPIYQWHADLRRQLLVAAWEHHGLLAHQTIIWFKGRPVLTRSHFMWQHEPCLYGWRKRLQPETDRRPPNNAVTVWEVNQQGASNDLHPTEKPVELFSRPIGWHTRAGELCYEPFSGSGTQIIAAHGLGRRCYALEIAPQYVDVACRRFQEHTGIQPVLEATGEAHDFTNE